MQLYMAVVTPTIIDTTSNNPLPVSFAHFVNCTNDIKPPALFMSIIILLAFKKAPIDAGAFGVIGCCYGL
jgi:hypothetical protein